MVANIAFALHIYYNPHYFFGFQSCDIEYMFAFFIWVSSIFMAVICSHIFFGFQVFYSFDNCFRASLRYWTNNSPHYSSEFQILRNILLLNLYWRFFLNIRLWHLYFKYAIIICRFGIIRIYWRWQRYCTVKTSATPLFI